MLDFEENIKVMNGGYLRKGVRSKAQDRII